MDPISLIPIHFEQLKELRNGTISYIQIIKRDQTRPPVRPVCRKLGVAKLSEIKSESDLYDALLCVASGQSQKSKDSEFSPHSPYSNYEVQDMLTSRSLDNGSNLFRSQSQINCQQQQLNVFGATGMSPPTTPRESLEQSLDFQALLECVLYIRVTWDPRDRSQRLDSFAYQYGLDEAYLLTALKRICEIIGCVHLSPIIDLDLVINATKICHKQMYASKRYPSHPLDNGHGLHTSARFMEYSQTARSLSSPRESSSLLSASNLRNLDGVSPYSSPREPLNEISARLSTRSSGSVPGGNKPLLSGLAVSNSSEFSPRYINDDLSGRTFKIPPQAPPVGSPFSMSRGLSTSPVFSTINTKHYEPDNRNLFNRDNRTVLSTGILGSGVLSLDHQYDRTRAPLGAGMLDSHQESMHNNYTSDSSNQSTPRELLDLPRYHTSSSLRSTLHLTSNQLHLVKIYELFWDQAFKVMYCVVDPDEKAHAFDKILELISKVAMSQSASPMLALALDTIVKKSILEISGKIDKFPVDKSPTTSVKSTDNISSCIGVLKHFIQHAAFANIRGVFNFSSEQLMYSLSEQLKWCASDRSDLNFEIAENIKDVANNRHISSVIDQAFYCMNNYIFLPAEWIKDVECIQYRLQKNLDISGSGLVFERYGASIIGIGNQKETEAEFIAKFPDNETRDIEIMSSRKEISRRVSVLENANALQPETQFDKCIKFLQQCLIDEKIIVRDLVSSNLVNDQERAAATSASALLNKLSMDSELFFKVGDKFIENTIAESQHRRKQPQLKALLDNLNYLRSQLNDKATTLEASKTQTLLNLSCSIVQLGYKNVHISSKLQDPIIKFVDHESSSTHHNITCSVSLDKVVYPHSSRLISEYYNSDSTGKIKQFAAIIKTFVRENELNIELSSYAWNIMTIHFLLRFGFLDNLQSNELLSASSNQPLNRIKVNDVDVTFAKGITLSLNCHEQINRTSLIELLLLFFHYFSYEGDIFSNVFTLRGKGQVIPKFGWSKFKPKVQWRFCLEDPFETGIGESPNDLGSNLTFKGQAKVFKYLRMAYFALAGMIVHPKDKLEQYAKDFVSRDKVFSLAIASGFNPTNEYPSIVSAPDGHAVLLRPLLDDNSQIQSSMRYTSTQNDLSRSLQRTTISDYSSSCSSPNDSLRRSLRSSPNDRRMGVSTHHEESVDMDRFVDFAPPAHSVPRKNSHPKVPSLNLAGSGILPPQQQAHDNCEVYSSTPKVTAASGITTSDDDDYHSDTFSSIIARSRQVDNIVQETTVNALTPREAPQYHNLFRNFNYDALSLPPVASETSGFLTTHSIFGGHIDSNQANKFEVYEEASPRLAGWLKSKK